MAFDIEAARKAGYSDGEIKQYLQQKQTTEFSAGQMVKNIPGSAVEFGKGIYQTVRHPIDTASNLKDIVVGAVSDGTPEQEQKASAVGQFYKNRYGSVQGFKNALMTDPVGVAADVSIPLTGGGMALAKTPGIVGRVGRAVSATGRAIDPANAIVQGTKLAAKGVGKTTAGLIGELGTHTGKKSIEDAYAAGKASMEGTPEGTRKAEEFQGNMRGTIDPREVLSEAKSAVDRMRFDRSNAYKRGMVPIKNDPAILSFKPILDSFKKMRETGMYEGKVVNESTVATQKKIADAVREWALVSQKDRAKFWSPAGFDALKRKIGDIRDSTEYGSPSRKVADNMYNAIKGEIVKQSPDYANVMKDYEKASSLIREIEDTLSLKKNPDTAIRKLQSLTRNNANTNYGNRVKLAQELEQHGADNLLSNLSGQSLSSVAPRGLGKLAGAGIAAGGAYLHSPMAIPFLLAQSPRLMGETAYYTGKAAGAANRLNPGISPQLATLLYQAKQPKE